MIGGADRMAPKKLPRVYTKGPLPGRFNFHRLNLPVRRVIYPLCVLVTIGRDADSARCGP
jgi:hypothetical protein